MPTGKIKWFNADKGFGFIAQDGSSQDVFVHWTAVEGLDNYEEMREGEPVSFEALIEAFREKLAPAILIPMHYRHPDLEPDPDRPDGLGALDGWLEEQDNVRRLATHTWQLGRSALPLSPQVLVFEHSPAVTPPQ